MVKRYTIVPAMAAITEAPMNAPPPFMTGARTWRHCLTCDVTYLVYSPQRCCVCCGEEPVFAAPLGTPAADVSAAADRLRRALLHN